MQLILASASPRRLALLAQLGLQASALPQSVDEARREAESLTDYVQRLAREKALAGWQASAGRLPVLGADTVVALGDVHLGKPADKAEALDMLLRLSAQAHQVYTAVTVVQGERLQSALSVSSVRFRAISPAEARAYVQSGEPYDKAGGYAIQGLGAVFVENLQGSYSGVMGLPLYETAGLMQAFGIPVLPGCGVRA